jgi:hypothetical protein
MKYELQQQMTAREEFVAKADLKVGAKGRVFGDYYVRVCEIGDDGMVIVRDLDHYGSVPGESLAHDGIFVTVRQPLVVKYGDLLPGKIFKPLGYRMARVVGFHDDWRHSPETLCHVYTPMRTRLQAKETPC